MSDQGLREVCKRSHMLLLHKEARQGKEWAIHSVGQKRHECMNDDRQDWTRTRHGRVDAYRVNEVEQHVSAGPLSCKMAWSGVESWVGTAAL
jgi:hypothetical protein